jgi:geranylgeranyl transferase type-2 subunit alpha
MELGGDDMEEETRQSVAGWLAELKKLDPLREGRWRDMERGMKL